MSDILDVYLSFMGYGGVLGGLLHACGDMSRLYELYCDVPVIGVSDIWFEQDYIDAGGDFPLFGGIMDWCCNLEVSEPASSLLRDLNGRRWLSLEEVRVLYRLGKLAFVLEDFRFILYLSIYDSAYGSYDGLDAGCTYSVSLGECYGGYANGTNSNNKAWVEEDIMSHFLSNEMLGAVVGYVFG